MSSKKKKLLIDGNNRRSFLKGAGTIAVGLPVFDFMLNSQGTNYAWGAELPKRFVTMYSGVGIGWNNNHALNYQPNKVGSGYDLKPGIKSLGDYSGLQEYTSIVTNLKIPYKKWAEAKFSDPGPGGLCGMFHRCSGLVQLSGTRVIEIEKKKYKTKSSPTADYIYANHLGQKPFYYAVQAISYAWAQYVPKYDFQNLTSRFYGYDMQVDMRGNHVQCDAQPQRVFNKLVGLSGDLTQSNPQNEQAINEIQKNKKSILDFLDKRRVQYLKNKLSTRNIAKLNDHFDFIREIEKGIKLDPVVTEPTNCSIPNKKFNYGDINVSAKWSDETKRAEAWSDVLTYAFKCDAMRSGMLQVTEGQSVLGIKNISGEDSTYHDSGHGPDNSMGIDRYCKTYNWHVKVMGMLANKLKNSQEGAGNILDNSAIVLTSEGGCGDSSDDGQNNSSHSVENMISIVCGKAGNLKGGEHIKTNKTHPSKVLISALSACSQGKINKLGEVTGTIPELFKST